MYYTYAARTDTDPIFLFWILNIESAQSPEDLTEFNEIELNEKVTTIAVIKYTYSCNSYFVHKGYYSNYRLWYIMKLI